MIRSTFYGFGTALSGMSVSQKALDVTGNNISNLNTAGYTRQRLDLYSIPSASFADRFSTNAGHSVGQGVNITRVAQVRDPFLDNRFRREASNIGELDANLSSLSDITGIFDEVQQKALQQALSDFRTQLQSYTDRTSEVEIESTVRAAAESVTRLFTQYAKELSTVRENQENLLDDSTIPEVNTLIKNIATLNQSIKECEIYGNPALELKDQRNMYLDELSTYMKIDVAYEPDAQMPHIDNLRVTFLADNVPALDKNQRTLIFNDAYETLSIPKDPATQEMIRNPITIVSSKAAGVPINFTTGALKGALDMLNKSAAFDAAPNTNNVKGIGYYEKLLDVVVSDFAKMFNDANSIAASAGPPPVTAQNKPLFATNDGSTTITAKNIIIAPDWANGTYGLTTTKEALPPGTASDQSGGRENILYMITLLDKKSTFTTNGVGGTGNPIYTGTFQEMFSNIGLVAAQDVSSKEASLESYTAVITGIEDLRNSLSSVSMDEEGVNLLRFQKSYAAAARVMTTLDEALDVLINKTGLVGR